MSTHDKFLIYGFMNLYLQHASCVPIRIPDADFIASQITACAQTLGKRPDELTSYDCNATISTRRAVVLSAFGVAAVGPKNTCINPWTGKISDKVPVEKMLRKRRQYIPTDLISCSLIGKVVKFEGDWPYNTTRLFRPHQDGRNGKGGTVRLKQGTISAEVYNEEGRKRVERAAMVRPEAEFGIIPPPGPPAESNKATLIQMQKQLDDRNHKEMQLILLKIGEKESVEEKPVRRRTTVSVPKTPPIVSRVYMDEDRAIEAAKKHYRSFKKTGQLVYMACCGNTDRMTPFSWGPFDGPRVWCFKCPNPEFMRRLMKVCRRCNSLAADTAPVYTTFDERLLRFVTFRLCDSCVRGSYELFSKGDIPLCMGMIMAALLRQSMRPFNGYFGMDIPHLESLHFVPTHLKNALPPKKKVRLLPVAPSTATKKTSKKSTKVYIQNRDGVSAPMKRVVTKHHKHHEAGGNKKNLQGFISKVGAGTV
jgi:Zn finger protein HypA/HybF involved in hydrogenase expression